VRQTWSQDRVFFLDASAGSARRRWALRLRLFSIATLTCHALRTPPQLYAHTAWARPVTTGCRLRLRPRTDLAYSKPTRRL